MTFHMDHKLWPDFFTPSPLWGEGWGEGLTPFLRDRRVDAYGGITKRFLDEDDDGEC